jgi:hypothetical protein
MLYVQIFFSAECSQAECTSGTPSSLAATGSPARAANPTGGGGEPDANIDPVPVPNRPLVGDLDPRRAQPRAECLADSGQHRRAVELDRVLLRVGIGIVRDRVQFEARDARGLRYNRLSSERVGEQLWYPLDDTGHRAHKDPTERPRQR